MQGPELSEEQREQEAQWGPPRGDPTNWASCLRIVDPSTLETASVIELDNNEAAISMCCMRFSAAEGHMLAVGTVQGLGFLPRTSDGTHCPSSPHSANALCHAMLRCAALRCAVLCCAVLCCAVLCCAVLCWPPSDAVLAGFSESAAAVVISSNSNINLECYSTVYVLANSHARKQRHAKGPAHRCRSLHLAKAVLMLCRGLCPAL